MAFGVMQCAMTERCVKVFPGERNLGVFLGVKQKKKRHFYEDLSEVLDELHQRRRQYSFETKMLLLNHIRGRKRDREED